MIDQSHKPTYFADLALGEIFYLGGAPAVKITAKAYVFVGSDLIHYIQKADTVLVNGPDYLAMLDALLKLQAIPGLPPEAEATIKLGLNPCYVPSAEKRA